MVARTATEVRSLEQLLAAACKDTGQFARMTDFLLSWWNAGAWGKWVPTDLWKLDQELADAILVLLDYVKRSKRYPHTFGFRRSSKLSHDVASTTKLNFRLTLNIA